MDITSVQPYFDAAYQRHDEHALKNFLGRNIHWSVNVTKRTWNDTEMIASQHSTEMEGKGAENLTQLFSQIIWNDASREYWTTQSPPRLAKQKASGDDHSFRVLSLGEGAPESLFVDETQFQYSRFGKLKKISIALVTLINAPEHDAQRQRILKEFGD